MKPEKKLSRPYDRFRKLFSWRLVWLATTVVAILLLIWFLWSLDFEKIIQPLKRLKLWHIFVLFFIENLILFMSTLRWKVAVNSFTAKIPLWKLFLFRYPMNAINFTTPLPGITGQVLGVVFLKKEGLDWKPGTIAVLLDVVIAAGAAIVFNSAFLAAFFAGRALQLELKQMIFIAGSIIILGTLALFGIFWLRKANQKKVVTEGSLKILEKIKEMVSLTAEWGQKNPKKLSKMIFLNFLTHGVVLAEVFLALAFLGIAPSIIEVGLIEAFFTVSFFTPTWQDIGGFEAAGAFSTSIIGWGPEIGLGAAFLIRAFNFISAAFGFIYLAFWGLRNLRKDIAQYQELSTSKKLEM